MRRFLIFLLVLTGCTSSPATADEPLAVMSLEEGQASPAASIDDLAWIAGHWKGEGLGGVTEEIIAPATGGQMPGMFRYVSKKSEPGFYEFYLFTEHKGSLVLRIKHFNPDMTGWEEKDEYEEFPLVVIKDTEAYFDGLTYAVGTDGRLRAAVRIEGQEIAYFDFEKVTPGLK